ncbi:hypothetical protein ACP70R_021498 [Stipagrostis hirtigluma subsp. patula]
MDVVCEACGVVGYKHLLVQCNYCKSSTRHRYCMDIIIYGGSPVEWLCNDCLPKRGGPTESLDDVSSQRQPCHIQLGSSIVNGANMNSGQVTKGMWSWGKQRYRSRKARKGCTDLCAKQFLGGDTFNSSETLVGEKLEHNDVKNEVESKINQVVYEPGNIDGSIHSASVPVCEIEEQINYQKPILVSEPILNSMEQLKLSKERDFHFSSSYVEGSTLQGMEADLLPSNNDSSPFLTDDSSPTLPSVERADGFSPTLETEEQPEPLEVVVAGSNSPSNYSQSMQGSYLYVQMDVLGPSTPSIERLDSRSMSQTVEISSSSNEQGVFERSHQIGTDDSTPTLPILEQTHFASPTMESEEQPRPLAVVKPLVHEPKSILGSKPPSNYSQPMQGSDLNLGNLDVLDPVNECLSSRSMSKTVQSSLYEQGSSSVDKDSLERRKSLANKEIVSPALDNLKGSASSSMAKECLAVANSDEASRSDQLLLSSIDMRAQMRVPSSQDILNGEVHCSYNGHSERGDALKLNEGSNPTPSGEGNQQRMDVQCDVVKSPFCANKEVVGQQVPRTEGVSPSKHVDPRKSTKSNSKKRCNLSNRQTPPNCKHQKIKKKVKVDPAQLRSARCTASLEDSQKTPDAGSRQLDPTYSSASLELSSERKEVCDANGAEQECSNAAQTLENGKSKKRKQPVLPLNKDEHADTTMVEDLNPRSCKNDGHLKKHKSHAENGVTNKRKLVANCGESLQPGNLHNCSSNNHTQVKKRRSIDANQDENARSGNLNIGCSKNDAARLASQTIVADDHHDLSRTPVVSQPANQRQRFTSVLPIDKPYWTGIMKLGREYISLAAHFSTKACNKVHELSRSLPPVMKVKRLSKLKAWPKRFKASEPTADSIGLYFFSNDRRPNKELDRLVQYVTDHSIVLKYTIDFAKLLIFPSVLLPEQCQMFQGKHYLWGVFQRRKGMSNGRVPFQTQNCTLEVPGRKIKQQKKGMSKGRASVQKQDRTLQAAERKKEQQEKDMSKGRAPVQKQDSTAQAVDREKEQQEKGVSNGRAPQQCASQVAERKKEQQEKRMGKGQAPVKEQDSTWHVVESKKEQQEKGIRKGRAPAKKQHCTSQAAERSKERQENGMSKRHTPVKKQD